MLYVGLRCGVADLAPYAISVCPTKELAITYAMLRTGRPPEVVVDNSVKSWEAIPVDEIKKMLLYSYGCSADGYPDERIRWMAAFVYQHLTPQRSPFDFIDNGGSKSVRPNGLSIVRYNPKEEDVIKLNSLLERQEQSELQEKLRQYFSIMLLVEDYREKPRGVVGGVPKGKEKGPAQWRDMAAKMHERCDKEGIEWDLNVWAREKEIFFLKRKCMVSYKEKSSPKNTQLELYNVCFRNRVLRDRRLANELGGIVFNHMDEYLLTYSSFLSKQELCTHLYIHGNLRALRMQYTRYLRFYGIKGEENGQKDDDRILEAGDDDKSWFSA